jgi:hypothetical protein
MISAKDDDTDKHPMHGEESPEVHGEESPEVHDEESPEVLTDAPPTDVKNSTEEGLPEVLTVKNSLDEEEEYKIEEIDDDGNAVNIEEGHHEDDEADKDEAPTKE